MAIQQTAQIYDISAMSRAAPLQDAHARQDQVSPTMSYPQRIAAMLAHAPRPPKLRRTTESAAASLSEETRAKLISVHTLNATLGPARH